MQLATLARHEWTSADYERMLAAGMFEKIELLAGDVVITGAAVRPYRWTLDDYEQLIALGPLRASTWNSSRERCSPWHRWVSRMR
jgi:hypothetical protein